MDFERAKAALAGLRFADLRWVAATGSTNDDVRRWLTEGSAGPEPVVLVADHQTQGRGRLDRSWQAPPGSSVLMTVGLPVSHVEPPRHPLIPIALALAVTDAFPQLALKWPNDLVVPVPADELGYRKAGGLLAEALEVDGVPWLLVGLGLNVNWPSFPPELEASATSLDRIVGRPVDRADLVVGTLTAFATRWLPLLEDPERVTELLGAYRARTTTLGARVRVQLFDTQIVGVAADLRDDGALVVTDDGGVEHAVTAGDVVHLRPVAGQGSSTSS